MEQYFCLADYNRHLIHYYREDQEKLLNPKSIYETHEDRGMLRLETLILRKPKDK